MKAKFIYFFLVIAIVFGASLLVSTENAEEGPKEEGKKEETVYFVPVTNYFSEKENITKEELTEIEVVTLLEDEYALPEFVTKEKRYSLEEFSENTKEILPAGKVGVIRWDRVTPNLKTLKYEGKLLWNKDDAGGYTLKRTVWVDSSYSAPAFDAGKLVKINFVGDVMLSRTVGRQIASYGYDYPWEKTKKQIADADITFANLEVPISDLYPSPLSGMSFVAPEENLKYIKEAGIDIVSVANNHSANFGYNVFLDNIKNLKASGIKMCGGGKNEAEARSASVIEASGNRFGFLCQSAVTGSLYADSDSAGVPYLGIEPWYRDDNSSISDLVSDVTRAKKVSDTVIASPHWGVEYKHYPNDSQEMVARKIIDTGAELVVGTHPHVVESLEYYKGKYINYSLGNFIFDQEWSQATKEGVMLSSYFYAGRNVASALHPLEISNYAQPSFVSGRKEKNILKTIKEYSVGLY